jgi:hypothetical protein
MVKRYKRGNKKQYIKEGHTIQWSKDTLWSTVSYYLFCIFWPLYWMSFFDVLFLINSLVSFDHCIVCPSLMYCFLYQRRTYNTMVNRYQRGNKKQYIKEGHSIQWSKDTKEVIRNSTSKKDIQYNGSLVSFDHCIECPSLMYCFLFPLLYLLTIVLNVLLWSTVSYCLFCICWPLYWMSFFDVLSTSKRDIQYNGQKIPKR